MTKLAKDIAKEIQKKTGAINFLGSIQHELDDSLPIIISVTLSKLPKWGERESGLDIADDGDFIKISDLMNLIEYKEKPQ